MKTCGYCGNRVTRVDDVHFHCTFCEMSISMNNITENEERKAIFFRDFAFVDWIKRSTPELMTMHTVELLLLLREVRKARSDQFGTLHLFNQVDEEQGEEITEAKSYQGNEYEYVTRKAWIIENILRDRLGYVPERMSQSFLIKQIEQAKRKPKAMRIRKVPKKSS